jgi:hypothetical protein
LIYVSFGIGGRELLESNVADAQRLQPAAHGSPTRRSAAVRGAADWVRLKPLSPRFVLHISHRNGGGTNQIEDLARRLHHALIVEANPGDRGVATIRNLDAAKFAADAGSTRS